MDHVSILSVETPDTTIADINNITLTFDILSLVKDKQLKTTITVDGLHAGDTLCNAVMRTISRKTDTYMKAFDPSLIDSIFVIEGILAKGDLKLRDVFGILKLDNMSISEGKIHFMYGDAEYLTAFARARKDNSYDVTVRSDNLGFQSMLVNDNGRLIVNNLKGLFYAFQFDLKGEIRDYFSTDMVCSLNGTVEADLGAFGVLPGEIGLFARRHPMSGPLKINLYLKTKEPKLSKCELTSTISGSNLRIENFFIKDITTKLSLENGRLDVPLINGSVYGGAFTCNLKMDLTEKYRPYLFNNKQYGLWEFYAGHNKKRNSCLRNPQCGLASPRIRGCLRDR
jgi:hypothetical protein